MVAGAVVRVERRRVLRQRAGGELVDPVEDAALGLDEGDLAVADRRVELVLDRVLDVGAALVGLGEEVARVGGSAAELERDQVVELRAIGRDRQRVRADQPELERGRVGGRGADRVGVAGRAADRVVEVALGDARIDRARGAARVLEEAVVAEGAGGGRRDVAAARARWGSGSCSGWR